MAEQWVTMTAAAKRLNISVNRISRWAAKGIIKVQQSKFDARVRLVDLNELRQAVAALEAIADYDSGNEG